MVWWEACGPGDTLEAKTMVIPAGRDVVSAVGAEVDRIEGEIQRLCPNIRYVDLETDRGLYRQTESPSPSLDTLPPALATPL